MRFQLRLIDDAGNTIYEDDQQINPGFDFEVWLSQPIIRYSTRGQHRIEGFKVSFLEHVEKKLFLA